MSACRMTGLILPCRGHGPETHSASRSSLALCLRVSAAARLDAPAAPLGDPAELFQNLLAVRDAPGDLLEWLPRRRGLSVSLASGLGLAPRRQPRGPPCARPRLLSEG